MHESDRVSTSAGGGHADRMRPAHLTRHRFRPSVGWPDLLTLVLSAWLLWPQRLAGFGLGHDMVFTPDQPLNAGSIGLGSTPPRAVPLDALVALVSTVLGGEVTGRIALVVPLLAAGWGTVRLLDDLGGAGMPGRLLAAGFAVWNPFVVERLALGQWALLWCYGALPWLVRAVRRRRWPGLILALAAASITPTGAIIAATTALVLAWPWQRLRVIGAAVVFQLPWLLPALTGPAGSTSDPAGVAAFATRAERPGGGLGSLLGLGGIWNAEVTPASRGGALGYLTAAVVVAAVALAWPRLPVRLRVLAGAGFVLAGLTSVPGGAAVVRWAVRVVPGAGLLRDGQKWLLPAVLVAALATGLALDRLLGLLEPHLSTGLRWVAGVFAVVLPLLLLPDGPATLRIPLTPVHYPAGWSVAAREVRGSGHTVLVLPFSSYRNFDWAPGRTVLDPAPRLLDAPVLVDDRLVVGERVLRGEDPAVRRYLQHPNDLAAQGIGWVLVESGPTGPVPTDLTRLDRVLSAEGVTLYRVPSPIATESSDPVRTILVIGVDLLVAVLVLGAVVAKVGRPGSSRRREDR